MLRDAALRIFWAMQQEALCHDCLPITPDDLRIIYHLPHHFQLFREPGLPDLPVRIASLRN